jgi:hypothetical protein
MLMLPCPNAALATANIAKQNEDAKLGKRRSNLDDATLLNERKCGKVVPRRTHGYHVLGIECCSTEAALQERLYHICPVRHIKSPTLFEKKTSARDGLCETNGKVKCQVTQVHTLHKLETCRKKAARPATISPSVFPKAGPFHSG